jgi:hypothetical protein
LYSSHILRANKCLINVDVILCSATKDISGVRLPTRGGVPVDRDRSAERRPADDAHELILAVLRRR